MNDESSNFTQQLTECYFILSNITVDPQKVEEASRFLMNFYSQPKAFSFIVNYISIVDNPILQKGAIVGMKMILQSNHDLLQNHETYLSLLNLSVFQSPVVRKFAIFYLSNYKSPETIELIIQFVQSNFNPDTINSINDIQIEAFMKLLTIVIKSVPEENVMQYIELCSTLSSKAYQSSNIDLLISAAIFRLTFIPFLQDGQNSIYQEYMNSALQVFIQFVQQNSDSDQSTEFFNAICDFISNDPYSINFHPLLELVINYIVAPEISEALSNKLLLLSDSILDSCQDIIKEDQKTAMGLMVQLLSSYCLYSKKTYSPSNSYDQCNIFSTFFNVFYEDEYISEIYSNIPSLFNEGSSGKFTSLLIIESALNSSSDFYASKVSELYSILQTSLNDQDFCVRSASSFVLSDFCQILHPTIAFDSIITSLFNCIQLNPSIEFLNALTEIFEVSTQTDTIFEQCYTFLFNLFQTSVDMIVQQRAVECISSLTKKSNEKVCSFYDQIFAIMSHIVLSSVGENQPDDLNSILIAPSISCLSHLCESCTRKIESFIPSFLEVIMANINDLSSQFQCIDALSHICEYFSQQARSIVPQILKTLFEVASNEVKFSEFNLNDADVDGYGEIDDEFEFQKEINSNAAAVRVICKIFSIYPDLLIQFFNEVYSILLKFKDSESGDGTVACAIGVGYISKALVSLDGSDSQAEKIINDLLLPLKGSLVKSSDPITSGNAFTALSILIVKSPSFLTEKVFDAISMVLNGELLFQSGRVTYNECLFTGLLKTLKSIMKMNFFNGLQPFIPIIHGFLGKSSGLRDFSLKFFGSLISISKSAQILPVEMSSLLIQTALTVGDGYGSIEFLTKLIETAPDSILEIVPKIVDMVKSRVFESSGGDVNSIVVKSGNSIVVEKCVLLIRSLLQKLNTDISVFIPVILQSTPPKVLLSKTDRFFQLIQWIYQNQDGSLNQQIATCVVLLLSESDNLLFKRKLSDEQLASIKMLFQLLMPSIPNFNDFCAQICNNEQFKLEKLAERTN
ncbi:hypothetical protein M9Y10_038236 [Tritrichomonas musculus]|uniref:Importin N-terminal domain-containing protein n=1 Tax=Tritrichomonas musculus TaxID=1915356 RepID=A0ABR2K7U1_9EUKA